MQKDLFVEATVVERFRFLEPGVIIEKESSQRLITANGQTTFRATAKKIHNWKQISLLLKQFNPQRLTTAFFKILLKPL